MRISLRWVAVALLALATPASAHPVPFSYLDLRLQPHEIDGTLVAHIYDVAHDLNVSPMERLLDPAIVSRVSDALTALMSQRLQVAADGRVLTPTWARAEALPDRQSVRIRITYPTTTAAGVVTMMPRSVHPAPSDQFTDAKAAWNTWQARQPAASAPTRAP